MVVVGGGAKHTGVPGSRHGAILEGIYRGKGGDGALGVVQTYGYAR